MRRAILLAAIACFVAGCGTEAAVDPFVGTWHLDLERVRLDFGRDIEGKLAVAKEGDDQAFRTRLQDVLARTQTMEMEVVVRADNTYSATLRMDGASRTTRGTWKQVQGGWRMTTTHEDGKPVDATRPVRARIEDGKLVTNWVPEHTLRFLRR